jgi:hypothetical protein
VIKDVIAACIPEGTEIVRLDAKCALLVLPRSENRKAVIAQCREKLGEKKATMVQAVNGYKDNGGSIEVALPQMKRFFPKTG